MKQLKLFYQVVYDNQMQVFSYDGRFESPIEEYNQLQYTSNLGYTLHEKTLDGLENKIEFESNKNRRR